MFQLIIQLSSGESDKDLLKKDVLILCKSANQHIGANYDLLLMAKFKNSCGKCMPSSWFSGFLQVLISHVSKYVCCANLCLYVKSLKIPWRWCGQSVNNVPLKLTCASVCLQPLPLFVKSPCPFIYLVLKKVPLLGGASYIGHYQEYPPRVEDYKFLVVTSETHMTVEPSSGTLSSMNDTVALYS